MFYIPMPGPNLNLFEKDEQSFWYRMNDHLLRQKLLIKGTHIGTTTKCYAFHYSRLGYKHCIISVLQVYLHTTNFIQRKSLLVNSLCASILITSKTFNGKMEIVYICSMIWANNAGLLIVLIIFVCAPSELTDSGIFWVVASGKQMLFKIIN